VREITFRQEKKRGEKIGKKGSVTQKATSYCRHKWTEHVTDGGQKFLTDRRKGKVKKACRKRKESWRF
jgi:hypothetical protein